MVKNVIFWLMLGLNLATAAQNNRQMDFSGVLRAGLQITQGWMLSRYDRPVYISGFAEYFTGNKLSVRGDCLWYLDARDPGASAKNNLVVLAGGFCHFQRGRHLVYGGIQPGISIFKPQSHLSEGKSKTKALPVLCLSAGYMFFFSRFCHFSVLLGWINGCYRGLPGGSLNLSSLLLSGGLGFQLSVKSKKQTTSNL